MYLIEFQTLKYMNNCRANYNKILETLVFITKIKNFFIVDSIPLEVVKKFVFDRNMNNLKISIL